MEQIQLTSASALNEQTQQTNLDVDQAVVSLEAEVPEALYLGMKEFIEKHPNWDKYRVMSSSLANFLFQNGCSDRAVTEYYLNDLFNRSKA